MCNTICEAFGEDSQDSRETEGKLPLCRRGQEQMGLTTTNLLSAQLTYSKKVEAILSQNNGT